MKITPGKWSNYDFDEEEGKEKAYKAVLVISLSVTIMSWSSMFSTFPLVYQYIHLSNRQFDNVVEFCEFSARSVKNDSAILLNDLLHMPVWQRQQLYQNHTVSNYYRQ